MISSVPEEPLPGAGQMRIDPREHGFGGVLDGAVGPLGAHPLLAGDALT